MEFLEEKSTKMKVAKYLIFLFNFTLWLMGLLVLAVGLWLRFDQDTRLLLNEEGAPKTFFIGVYIIIGAGVLMVLVGFLACRRAIRQSQCLLGLFVPCLLVIFGAEIAAGVFGFLNKDKIIKEIQSFYAKSITEVNNSIVYHRVLTCCGVFLPNRSLCPEAKIETKDCNKAITEFFNKRLYIIGLTGIGITGVMVIGMICSKVLCCAIRNSREKS